MFSEMLRDKWIPKEKGRNQRPEGKRFVDDFGSSPPNIAKIARIVTKRVSNGCFIFKGGELKKSKIKRIWGGEPYGVTTEILERCSKGFNKIDQGLSLKLV